MNYNKKYWKYKNKYLNLKKFNLNGGNLDLFENDILELNEAFNLNYDKNSWNDLITLHIPNKIITKFPNQIDKLDKLKNIDMINEPPNATGKCEMHKSMAEIELEARRNFLGFSKKNKHPLKICLDGIYYDILDSLGSGEYGSIWKIKTEDDKIFALKIFYPEKPISKNSFNSGDWIALTKTKESRQFLNLPVVVNTEHNYVIYPKLEKSIGKIEINRQEREKVNQFIQETKLALQKDNLKLDDRSDDNIMLDINDNLWMIDFDSLVQI